MTMNKLKEALIQFANSNPSLFPNPNSYPTLIEQQFSQFFPDHHTTPNHPPYAAMIHRAIWELKEKGGCSEESISNFIQQEYVDLPWAHSTLLKHHLEKLCDGKEICKNHKQCYFLAGEDFDPISPSTSEKKLKKKKNSESGKNSSGARQKHKKQRTGEESKSEEQIIVVYQEQDQVVQPLNQVIDEEENQEGQILKIEDQPCENATDEIHSENVLVIEHDDVSVNEKQSAEQLKEKQTKTCGTMKRRRSKRIKNDEETQKDDEYIGDESNEVNQIVEIKMNDLPVQEDEELVNIEQIQTKKNPVVLQIEDCSSSDPGLHKSGMRRCTRSQKKTKSEKDEQKDPNDVVEYLSQDEQQAIETIEWNEEKKQRPIVTSTQTNGQRAKLRSSLKKTDHLMPIVEPLNPICMEFTSQLCDVDEPIQVQEPKDEPEEDKPKPKYSGRVRPPKKGQKSARVRPPKTGQMSAKECKVERRGRKRKLVKGEVSGKTKTANKKVQPNHKKVQPKHKMARRSGVKTRNRGC